MATQFDAVARLSVDIRGFSAASRTMTQQGGQMQRVFRDLHNVLNQVDIVEKKMAADLRRTLSVYSAVASAAGRYAQAVKALSSNSTSAANGVQNMRKAFQGFQSVLSSITGLGEKEAARLQRTISLYNQMASAILKVNQATAVAAKATQQSASADQQRQINAERLAAAQARAEQAQARLNQQLLQQRSAIQGATSAQNSYNTSLANGGRLTLALRSDLSELEQLYKRLSTAITASATASVNAAISHEAAFSQVIRVTQQTGKAGEEMQRQFEKLTTTLPVSFEELSKIGQLAAQTGVANDQLVRFADTVVRFSVTTGIASDQVTVLFARIADMLNLPTNQMNNFASTILKLGTISAATENEILKVAQSISSAGRAFGLSTEEVAGLSGALASLRIPPEWSRGSATRIFRDLDNAANEAGKGMEVLQEVLGLTADEITKLRRQDPGTFFLKFVEGMQKFTREGQLAAGTTRTITDVMSDLEINAVRDIDFITRLANNFSTLKTQTNEAFLEFARGTELTKQTEIVFGTTRQNIDNLKDAFQTFLAKAGTPFAEVIGFIAERLTVAIEVFQDFGPAGKTFLTILTGMISVGAAVAAAIALYRMALIRAARSVIAFNQVQRDMNGQAVNGRNVWRLYREQQEQTRNAIAATTAAQRQQNQAVAATGRTTGAGAAALNQTAVAMNNTATSAQRLSSQLSTAMTQYNRVVPATTAATAALRAQQITQNQAAAATASYAAAWARTERALPAATAAIRNGTASMQQQNLVMRSVVQNQQAIQSSTVAVRDAQLQLGLAQRQAAASAAAAAAGNRGLAASAVAAGVAIRGAAAAMNVFRAALASIGIGLVITALTTLFFALTKTKDASTEAAKAGFDAAGGMTAFGDAVRKDQQAIANGSKVIATYAATSKDLSVETRERINAQLQAARQEQTFIETVGGSVEALKEQAKGTGASAEQARGYVRRWEAADDVIKRLSDTLKGNSFQISESTQALGQFSVQQAVMNTEAAKNLKALEALRDFGPQLRDALGKMFSDPVAAAKILQDEIDRVNEKILDIKAPRDISGARSARRIIPEIQRQEIENLEDYAEILETVQKNAKLNEDAVRGGALANQAFGKSTEGAAQGADAMANGMDDAAGAAESLDDATSKLAERAEALTTAFSSLGSFTTAMSAAMEKAKARQDATAESQNQAAQRSEKLRDAQDNLAKALERAGGDAKKTQQAYNDYNRALKDIQVEADKTKTKNDEVRVSFKNIMDELEAVAQARLDRAQNLVRLSSRIPQDVLQELEKLGPEYSAFIQELTDKSDEELKKLFPVLRAAGEGASAAFGQGLAQVLPLVAGKGKAVGDAAAAALSQAIREATEGGGDIQKAIDGVVNAIKTSQRLNIPLDVAVDLGKTQGDINKVNKIINDAVASGRLTAEASIRLKTDLFTTTLAELQEKIKNTSLNAEGKAILSVEQYDRDRQRLIDEGTATTLKNLIGIEGLAKLNPTAYNQALELLKKLGIDTTKSNGIGVEGKASLDTSVYDNEMRRLQRQADEAARKASFTASAYLNTANFTTNLNLIEQASFRQGQRIQNNLTTTATVTVGYTYKQNNPPPNIYQAATGGWVRGPGGPTSDRVPMMLSDGEFVVNAKAAKRYGALIQALNDYGLGSRPQGQFIPAMRGDISPGTLALNKMTNRRLITDSQPQRRSQSLRTEPRTVITVNNTYPQAEPTSVTINRSLAYSAMLDGTI